MSRKEIPIIVYNDVIGKKLDSVKKAQLWVYEYSNPDDTSKTLDNISNLNRYRTGFTTYLNNRSDPEEKYYEFVWKYYIKEVDAEWKNINELDGYVYPFREKTLSRYYYPNISDNYQITKYGHFRNKLGIVHDLPLINYTKVKEQFIDSNGNKYPNTSLLYLMAIAFVDNPNRYTSAELRQNGIKTDTFFEGFDATRDIVWIPNKHQKATLLMTLTNSSDYAFEYIIEEIEELPDPEFPILSNINVINQYDSIKDSILDKTWTQIPNYPNYEIDKRGHIRNIKRKHINIPGIGTHGYYCATLCKDIRKTFSVHRLVALTFIPKTDDPKKVTVNHIDGNKLNNNVENLEWASYKEQNIHMCQVLHPDRQIILARRSIRAVRNNEEFEKLIIYSLFTIKNKLVGIDIDEKNKKIIVNDYIYKNELQFDSTANAAKYFHLLGFPETNVISYNIGINKDTFGYTWSYINLNDIEDERWKPIYEIQDYVYNDLLLYTSECEISSYGRIRKNGVIKQFKSNCKCFRHSTLPQREYKINQLVMLAFGESRPIGSNITTEINHKDGKKNNYSLDNLEWKIKKIK